MVFDDALTRGTAQLKRGELDLAQRSFRIALDQEPENVRALALLGLTYFRGNQFDQARPIYEHLVERAPVDAAHRMNLGLVYLKLNEADRAISALEASRALDPSGTHTVTYLGLAFARAGRYAEAYRSFLFAGQTEFATEIEINLTTGEREAIQAQLARTGTPAVVAARPASGPTSGPLARVSHPEVTVDSAAVRARAEPAPPSTAQRTEDSMQFVLPPRAMAAPAPAPGVSMISPPEITAAPARPAAVAERTPSGGLAPRPLSELATDELIRPEGGPEVFEVGAGGSLLIRVTDRVLTRLDGVHVTGGDLAYEVATRRSRGTQTEERFDHGGSPLHVVTGTGYLLALPDDRTFFALGLDDDILYLREDLVFAFETSLRWENGNVPGLRGQLPVVQFRGDGGLVLRAARPLVRVKLPAQGVVLVDAARLAGWIGRVIPRAVVPQGGGPLGATAVECTGEGIILIEPAPRVAALAPALAVATDQPASVPGDGPPPPPPARARPASPAPAPAEPPLDDEMDMSGVMPAEEPSPQDADDALEALIALDTPKRPPPGDDEF